MKQLFLAIILSLSSANVPAEMYKWVDEEGNVQYTQTPPPGSASATTVTPFPAAIKTKRKIPRLPLVKKKYPLENLMVILNLQKVVQKRVNS